MTETILKDNYYIVCWGQEPEYTRGDAMFIGPYASEREAVEAVPFNMLDENAYWGALAGAEERVEQAAIVHVVGTINVEEFQNRYEAMQKVSASEAKEREERAMLARLKSKYE